MRSASDTDLKRRVLSSLAATPAPTRASVVKARVWLWGCGGAGALAIFLLGGGVRPTPRPPSLIALGTAGTAAIVGVGVWLLLTRGRRILGRSTLLLAAAAVAAVAAFVAWRYGTSSLYGLTASWPERPGYRCLGFGVGVGAPPLAAALLAWRRTIPVSAFATGAAFGAGAGLGSALLADLWCPVSYLPHLLLGHVLPIAALAVAGGAIGSRLLRIRRL